MINGCTIYIIKTGLHPLCNFFKISVFTLTIKRRTALPVSLIRTILIYLSTSTSLCSSKSFSSINVFSKIMLVVAFTNNCKNCISLAVQICSFKNFVSLAIVTCKKENHLHNPCSHMVRITYFFTQLP